MTLNQVIKKIEILALSHKQIRNFYRGLVSDWLTERTTRYPSCFLEDLPGNLDIPSKTQTFGFRIVLLDLVNVSDETKLNEQDVQSDSISTIADILAEIANDTFTFWKLSASNPVNVLYETDGDMLAGASADIAISVMWSRDVCAVPTDTPIITEDMKFVYDEKYIATGTEGNDGKDIVVPEAVKGKKIILLTRESAVLYKVSDNPDQAEYTYDGETIVLGTPISIAGERFLILYRNY